MIATRESIMTALFDLLSDTTFAQPVQNQTQFKTKSRRLKVWDQVAKNLQPAMFLTEHAESTAYTSNALPEKLTMMAQIWVYIASGADPKAVPATDLNVVLDAIDKQLKPSPLVTFRQTLGGLVQHCRVDGQVLKVPGDEDGQGLILIPIKIFVT